MPSLSDIPIEVFIDNILPLLPLADLLRLGTTNKFFYLLAADETLWKRKLEAEFNFPASETARNTGWRFLYRRLANPKVYVWGQSRDARLGIPRNQLPTTIVPEGVPFPVRLHVPGVRVVALTAGGMSFHALDAKGKVYVWGALDGSGGALTSDGFSESCKRAIGPMRLELPSPIRSISCARVFASAMDTSSRVWTFTSWGRPFRLASGLLDRSSPDATPVQVECGWTFTAVLTESGDTLVYWPLKGRMYERVHETDRYMDERASQDVEANWKASAIPGEGKDSIATIPCRTWDLDSIDPVRLPGIPMDLPSLPGLPGRESGLKIVKIAGMDNNLIALTNGGHVLKYDKLGGEDEYQQGQWEYLSYFSEIDKVCEDAAFAEDADPPLKKPESMHITHISASFKTFFAYSTGADSLILMGRIDTDAPPPTQPTLVPRPPLRPTIIPTLQYRSVISVVVGDYHYGALTSTGELLTWGSFSKGALGLGDPLQIEAGHPGGFATEEDKRRMRTAPFMSQTPPEVTVPAPVGFDHNREGKRKGKERFAFGVAAAGWHMGALVIDLEPGEENEDSEDEYVAVPGAFPPDSTSTSNPAPFPGHTDGIIHTLPYPAPLPPRGNNHALQIIGHRGRAITGLPFRVGFAGRGMTRGWQGPFGPQNQPPPPPQE